MTPQLALPRRYPRFWGLAQKLAVPVLTVMLLTGSVFVVLRRLTPSHRAHMLHGVAEARMHRDLESAERVSAQVVSLLPGHERFRMTHVQILLLRGRYKAAQSALEASGRATGSIERRIFSAWALMGLEQVAEAARIIDGLPVHVWRNPAVALMRAELAMLNNRPSELREALPLAVRFPLFAVRARRFFPALAQDRKSVV